jgi:hypothetical protein
LGAVAEHKYSATEKVRGREGGPSTQQEAMRFGFKVLMQKSPLQKIFGSNLALAAREARGVPLPPWAFIPDTRREAAQNPQIVPSVYLYDLARTYFSRKPD